MFFSIALDWSLSFYAVIWIAFLLIEAGFDQTCVVRNASAAPRLLRSNSRLFGWNMRGTFSGGSRSTRVGLLVVQSETV